MSELKFDDGVTFNLEGELRIEKRDDGWYVVGKGLMCPADNMQDAIAVLREMGGRMPWDPKPEGTE